MLLGSVPAWDEDKKKEDDRKNAKPATSDELANLLNQL